MNTTLYKANKDEPVDANGSNVLMGTLVSSLHRLKDVNNRGIVLDFCTYHLRLDSCARQESILFIWSNGGVFSLKYYADTGFFIFGDVSIKMCGNFRLLLSLFDMRP